MARKPTVILPLATALAALASAPGINDAVAAKPSQSDSKTGDANATAVGQAATLKPTIIFNAGEDLLALTLTEKDGRVLAQHYSHYSHSSHASHASHSSHYSSRY